MSVQTDSRPFLGTGGGLARDWVFRKWTGPIAANVNLPQGSLAGALLTDANAMAPVIYPFLGDGTMRALGFVCSGFDNTGGAQGARQIDVLSCTGHIPDKNAGGGSAIVQADSLKPAYGPDNGSCSKLVADGPCVGLIIGIDPETSEPTILVDPLIAALLQTETPGSIGYSQLSAAIYGAFSTQAGAGAIDITHRTTKITSAAVGAVVTLADGAAGQRKSLVLTGLTTPGSHTAVVTPAHGGPWTLDTVGDAIEIEFDGTNWILVNDNRAVSGKFIPRIRSGLGHNNAGACTLVGAKVGDVVVNVENITDHILASASFEAVITVADQIQQSGVADLSAKTLMVFLRPLS